MRFVVPSFVLCSLLSLSGLAYACDIPPDYYEWEVTGANVPMKNILREADAIILGKFTNFEKPDKIKFKVRKSFKPKRSYFFKRKRQPKFVDVHHFYSRSGNDESQEHRVELLDNFLAAHRMGPLPALREDEKSAWGGSLSGIFHSSDCMRSVLLFSEQAYLIFLDEEDFIQALFSVGPDSDATLKKLSQALGMYKDEKRNARP